jgi:hypothetical protein
VPRGGDASHRYGHGATGNRSTSPTVGDVPKLVMYAAPSGPIATPAA